jgi:uncharacterized protein YukE
VTGEIRVDPTVVRQGAVYLSDAGRTISAVHRQFAGDIEDLGATKPWGHDVIGAAFQTNYDQIFPTMMEAWPKLATYLEEYATAVTYAAEAAEQANAAAQQRLTW